MSRVGWHRHALAMLPVLIAALWIMRHLLFSQGLPAGTDMLDLLARTRQNANWGALLNPWAPTGLGLQRQISLDNLLGLLTMVTGSATTTVKLVMLVLLVSSGMSAYWLVWKWYGSVFSAAIAGLLYMTSQALLGRVASGWLHYEALIAIAPVILYLGVALIDRFTLRNALVFALVLDALVLARPDMLLWVLPYLGIYVVIGIFTGRLSRFLRNLAKMIGVVVPVTLVLTAYLTLPLLAGIRAPWLSAGEVFQQIRFNLLDRSLTAYQSVLGLGRDMGYLSFNGQEWWKFHPFMPVALYYAVQGIAVMCAYLALTVRRHIRTLFLLACATVAPFLGKGIHEPVGGPYWWAVQHIPVFGNLRGPNRWLVVGTLAYAVLAAVTLEGLAARLVAYLPIGRRISIQYGYAISVALVALMLLPVMPTLRSGLLGWRPSPGEVALMRTVEGDRAQFMVASAPYDQSMRLVSQSGYLGWEHDLGVESALWTGHPAISTNGWSRGESDFVDYTASLLRKSDSAFTALLGAAGVKYLIKFDYAPSAPYLLTGAQDDPLYQQRSLESMSGITRVQETAGGALYSLTGASPILSFRPNIAVILGGRAGLAAFADLPDINTADWATFTADDLLTGSDGSFGRLIQYLHAADLILATGDTEQDIALIGTPPVARVPGITSDPGLDRKLGLLLTDESARRGSLADQSLSPPALVPSSSQSFSLENSGQLELWTRILFSGRPGSVRFFIDDRLVGTLIPLAPGEGGFRWVRVTTKDLSPGQHQIRVEGADSEYGGSFEVDETRLVDPAVRTRVFSALVSELKADRQKLAYSLDLSTAQYANLGTVTGVAGGAGYPLDSETSSFWQPTSSTGIRISKLQDPGGGFQQFQLNDERPYYAFASHAFDTAQSWQGMDALLLRYRGTGSGNAYNFLVDFSEDHTKFASIPIIDNKPGWQASIIRIAGRSGDWNHVVSVRIATKDKAAAGQLDLRPLRRLFPQEVVVSRDLVSPDLQPLRITGEGVLAGVTTERVKGSTSITRLRAVVPILLSYQPLRIVALPNHPVSQLPASPVRVSHGGTAQYTVEFTAQHRGVLVFNQAFDPHWRLVTNGLEAQPTARIESLTNGFLLSAGRYSGTVAFAGRELPAVGAGLAILALIAVAIALALLSLKKRRVPLPRPSLLGAEYHRVEGTWAPDTYAFDFRRVHPGILAIIVAAIAIGLIGQLFFVIGAAILVLLAVTLRVPWNVPLRLGLMLLALAPLCIAKGYWEIADLLALFAVVTMAITIALVIRQERSRLRTELE